MDKVMYARDSDIFIVLNSIEKNRIQSGMPEQDSTGSQRTNLNLVNHNKFSWGTLT